uniref:Uncharacterized protein n=1 Tax=Rhizophora mucronata TaxID=61149 RepID=A0A2P2PEQ8_RHIMU
MLVSHFPNQDGSRTRVRCGKA